jgi:hypothetical protein
VADVHVASDGKIYEYVTTQFAISKFTVTDIGTP